MSANTFLKTMKASQQAADDKLMVSMESPVRVGMIIFFLVFGVFGLWAAFAPLEGAAHAPGTVSVKTYKKIVQHLEGGIIREIRVQNGDFVTEGTPLIILDDTQAQTQWEINNSQFVAHTAREARLIAERDGLDSVIYPSTLDLSRDNDRQEIAAQNEIFNARRNSRLGEIEVLEQRIEQLQSNLIGSRVTKESKDELAASYAEELVDLQALLEQGFADKNRVRAAERNYAIAKGEAAELAAHIASTEIQIGETRLQILQFERRFQNEVVYELGETQTTLKDIRDRMVALQDIVSRTVIRAPVDGVVNGMQYHTVGGVIGSGTPIAEIVPQSEELIIEARVAPIDIDRVAEGMDATIRFSSFSSAVPTIFGRVISLSADALHDQATGATYYLARIEVTPEGIEDLGSLELLPGMPAEAFIATGSRTFLQYLFKPFTNALARSFIED